MVQRLEIGGSGFRVLFLMRVYMGFLILASVCMGYPSGDIRNFIKLVLGFRV